MITDIGVDSQMERLSVMARLCDKALAKERFLPQWDDAGARASPKLEIPQRLIEHLHRLGATAARRCFHAVNGAHFLHFVLKFPLIYGV